MAKKEVAQKLIVVESVGTIGELGGISGPVLSPCYVPITTINSMLNHHRRVYEVNPDNYNERVPLSLKNLRKENFVRKNPTVKPRMAPDITTKAVVRNSNAPVRAKTFDDAVAPVIKATPKKAVAKKTETPAPDSAVVDTPQVEEKITSDFIKND